MAPQVDINCDMGESFGVFRMGEDEQILASVSSANVACGFHAGDPRVMDATVLAAANRGVAVGAHPGFPDLQGFGRRNLKVSAVEARTDVLYQIGALSAFCRRHGITVSHVKPHGQLNNLAFHDRDLAEAIVAGIGDFREDLVVVAYGGWLRRAAEAAGLPVAHEVYADRAYQPDGTLVPRAQDGALIRNPDEVARRAVDMVREGRVQAVDGSFIDLQVDTICVHGDTPGAASLAKHLRAALSDAGIDVAPMGKLLACRGSRPQEI